MPDKEGAKQEIKKLLEKYTKVIEEKRIGKYNEETTKKDFILPLFRALGWEVEDSNEVTAEEKISKKRVDYGFRINGIPKFFLEAKSLKEDLDNEKFAEQAINYSWHKGCTWAILTNFETIRIYNAEWKAANPWQSHLKSIQCNELLDRFAELWLLSRDGFEQGLLDKEAEKWGKKTKKTPVDRQLLDDFTRFRELLSKNITKLNQSKGLNEEDLDESVQRILDRLIFIRNCEDRELEEKILISNFREWESGGRGQLIKKLRETFAYFDKQYNSKIFANHLCDTLDIDNEVLHEIIEGLYYTKDRSIYYDFSAIEADVLGNIYEQYLGHILKKTEKRATITEAHAHRKEQGIYYTPTYIVDYIVRNTLGELLKDKKVNADKIRVLDPACGSGSFLIKTFDVLNEYYAKHDKNYNQMQLDVNGGGATYTRKLKIMQNNIFGVDLDKQAVEVAQLNLLLKMAEKGHRLPLLQGNIKCGNSLIDDENVAGDKAFKWENEFKQIMDEGGFDVVVGNPPYIRIQTLGDDSVDCFNSHYKSATKNYDIYTLFVERGLSLLKEGGLLGFILPSKFLNADYGEGLRKIIAADKSLCKIVDFKDFQVFEGATTYTCLLFLKKTKNKQFEYIEVSDKEKLQSDMMLSPNILKKSKQEQPEGEEKWNFVSSDYIPLMEKLDAIKLKLKDITDNIYQGIITGADKIFIMVKKEGRFYSLETKKSYKLEKELLHPLLKGSKHIRRYRIDPSEKYVIFPYRIVDNKATPISELELKDRYLGIYDYLSENKQLLQKRDGGKMNGSSWYLFSRNQNLTRFSQQKIMTPCIAKVPSFTYDSMSDFFFVGSGGGGGGAYGVTLKDTKLYHYILGILNSKLTSFFIKQTSSKFSGGFFAFNRQYIERIPIVIRTDSSRDKIEEFVKKQLKNYDKLNELGDKKTDERARVEEEIKKTDAEIDELVYKIYGITKEEQKVIDEN